MVNPLSRTGKLGSADVRGWRLRRRTGRTGTRSRFWRCGLGGTRSIPAQRRPAATHDETAPVACYLDCPSSSCVPCLANEYGSWPSRRGEEITRSGAPTQGGVRRVTGQLWGMSVGLARVARIALGQPAGDVELGGNGVLRIAFIHAACGGINRKTHHAAHQFAFCMLARSATFGNWPSLPVDGSPLADRSATQTCCSSGFERQVSAAQQPSNVDHRAPDLDPLLPVAGRRRWPVCCDT